MKYSTLVATLLVAANANALPAMNSIPSTMTAAYKAGFNPHCVTPFACVKTHTINTPKAGKGQVLVQVAASSVNPCDVDYLEFDVGCSGGAGTLGMDLAGTVVEVGPGCTGRLQVGDRVWADSGGVSGDSGSMAQYALVSEAQTGLAPSNLNLTEAGTVPLAALTAFEMWQKVLAALGVDAVGTTVVTAGTGGTGYIGLQLGKHVHNASTMITSTSGAEAIALARAWGADVVIDYKVQDDVFSNLTDNSVNVVFDNYGEKGTADKAMRVLKPGGVYIILPGGGGGTISNNPKQGVTQINFGYTSSDNYETLDQLKVLFEKQLLVPHIYQQVPLSNAAAAFALSKTGEVLGKVAVVVDASDQ
eukprot:m.31077 g.31077  ORF g.31077 m.31077 type:complete len:361 (-) comp16394_c0_seq1:1571-2653(-)